MLAQYLTADALISFFTLTALEIVLGIDNIIFISILVGKLPAHEQKIARQTGLALALIFRVLLLLFISWIAGLTTPVIEVLSKSFSGRDLIMLFGGLFLLAKSTLEIHTKIEEHEEEDLAKGASAAKKSFMKLIAQIVVLDLVFSFDSVITAVGLANQLPIMISAVVIALFVMLWASSYISDFINKHPTVKMLALAFLLMVGLILFIEGFGVHVPKGYIYFAMAFSFFVEMLNLRMRKEMRKKRAV